MEAMKNADNILRKSQWKKNYLSDIDTRLQIRDRDRGVSYFTKLLITSIILFPCFMKEMCKWSIGGVILTEK
jgi:hypothetical protein